MGRFGADTEGVLARNWTDEVNYFLYRSIVISLLAFHRPIINYHFGCFLGLGLRLPYCDVVQGLSFVATLLNIRRL